MAMGRAMDDVIIAAATGTAYTGETGSGTESAQTAIAASVGSTTGLNITKLRTAKELLDKADVDPSIPRHIVCGPEQITNLLGTTEVTSSDFNTIKALVHGEVDSFLGFKFTTSNRLAKSGNDRTCIAYAQDGITLGIGKDISARIDERADKSYATQVYYCQSIGSTRMEQAKVVPITCTEA